MILPDTNIIIDYWESYTNEAGLALLRWDPCVCGVVMAELLHGALNEWEVAWMQRALSKFRWLETHADVWRCLGLNLTTLRRGGLKMPFQDVLLATVAIVHDVPVWSHDKHFALMQQKLPALRLFTPEIEG